MKTGSWVFSCKIDAIALVGSYWIGWVPVFGFLLWQAMLTVGLVDWRWIMAAFVVDICTLKKSLLCVWWSELWQGLVTIIVVIRGFIGWIPVP